MKPVRTKADRITAVIKALQTLYGVSSDEMALRLKLSRATFYARRSNPGQFTLTNLRDIAQTLHTSPARLMEMQVEDVGR